MPTRDVGRRGPILGLAVLFAGYFGVVLYCDLVRPEDDGLKTRAAGGQLVVLTVAPDSPASRAGLRQDDAIVAVNGQPVRNEDDWETQEFLLRFGAPWTVQGVRGGAPFETILRFDRAKWTGVFSSVSMQVLVLMRAAMLLTLALGVFLALRRPHDPVALVGASLLASLGVFSVVWPSRLAAVWHDLPFAIGVGFWIPDLLAWTVGAQLFVFFLLFPERRSRRLWFWMVALAPIAAVLAWWAGAHMALVYSPDAVPDDSVSKGALIWTNITYLAIGLGTLLRRYGRLTDVNDRRRVRVLLVGSVTGWAGGVLTIANFWFGRSDPTAPVFASAWSAAGAVVFLAFPVSFAYAILRHRLFDVRVMIRLGMRYALARGVYLSLPPVLAGLLTLDVLRHYDQPLLAIVQRQGLLYIVVGGVALLAYSQRGRWLSALDRRFFRERYDARAVLGQLATELRGDVTFDQIIDQVVGRVETTLHPEFAAIVVKSPTDAEYRAVAAAPAGFRLRALPASSTLMQLVRVLNRPVDVALGRATWLREQLPDRERELLAEARIDAIVPIAVDPDRREAVLVLGARRSEEPYTRDDINLLIAIAGNLALLIRHSGSPTSDAGVFTECPECGACYDSATTQCRREGARLNLVPRPRLLASRYRFDRRLGRGGMGAVYEAFDTALERRVAVKVIRGDLLGSQEALARFQYEARVAAKFSHPNVVTIYDFGVTPTGVAFIVMELLDGRTVRERLQQEGPFDPAMVLAILRDVASAVDAAHRQGLIHRDLKPENLFLVPQRELEVAKVLDFGIAKSVAAESGDVTTVMDTRPGQLVGTPLYMAPEQIRRGDAAASWDLWSLALVTCEMLTGAHPLRDAVPGDVETYRPHIARHLASVPAPWRAFFERSLDVDPARRPQSTEAFVTELRAALPPG